MQNAETEEEQVLVFDIGAYSSIIGFAGDDTPFKKFSSAMDDSSSEVVDVFSLDTSDTSPRPLSLDGFSRPVGRGRILDRDKISVLWDHCFDTLITNATDPGLVYNVSPMVPASDREFIAEEMFEKYPVKNLFLEASCVLGGYNRGVVSGVVINAGDGHTSVVAMYNGRVLPMSALQSELGGNYVNQTLSKMICAQEAVGKGYRSINRKLNVNDDIDLYEIKHSTCYAAQCYDNELENSRLSASLMRKCKLPDGSVVNVEDERFMAPEVLFDPKKFEFDSSLDGISTMIWECIQQSAMDLRSKLYRNIFFQGGNSLLSGMLERVRFDLVSQAPERSKHLIEVNGVKESEYPEWCGGSVLGSWSSFEQLAIPKGLYNEMGPNAVYRNKGLALNAISSAVNVDS